MSRAIDRFVLHLCESLLRLIGRHSLANLVADALTPRLYSRWERTDPACVCGSAGPADHTPGCPAREGSA